MTDLTFDPKSIFEAYRKAFAPALKAQEDGLKVIDRAGRCQYALAGDYLEWSLAQAKVAVGVQSPAEFVSKQIDLATAFGDKLRARVQEFVTLTTEATAKVVEATKAEMAKATDIAKVEVAKKAA
jgi:hypothetical protein